MYNISSKSSTNLIITYLYYNCTMYIECAVIACLLNRGILFIQYTHLNNGTLVRMWLIQNSYMYMYVYGSAGIVNYM